MADLSSLLLHGTARAIGEAIASGATTSQEVTGWYLERIQRLNFGPHGLNCVRTLSSQAMQQAALADREVASGQRRGPLHGVPYLLKDNIFTADGSPASAGCKALSDFAPPFEATVVSRLREAGAVLLGKTNLTEFADFVSDVMPSEFSGAGGVVRNPLGPRYDRGQGSSVGSASAVAARFCAFAIGTETQNSIQTPATFSSVVGFKPTVGSVSRHGIVPLVPSQDSPGPLTVSVEDAALVFHALEGVDMKDLATLSSARRAEASNLPCSISIHGLRIGVPRRLVAENVLNAETSEAFSIALARLAEAGAVIVDPCDLPSAEQLHEVRSSVFRTEFKESLNELLSTLQPCGLSSMEEIITWNRENPDAIPYGQSLLEAANATTGTRAQTYIADRKRDILLSDDSGIRAALHLASADVLLSPLTAAAKCTGKAGAPVVAIPVGESARQQPFGVTVYSAPGSDRALLRAASAIESVIGKRMEPELG